MVDAAPHIVVASLNVGGPRPIADAKGHLFQSAMRRAPRTEARFLGERGFVGDSSYEDMHHTPNMDVHAFSLDRYPHFEALAEKKFPVPAFGENFSLRGGIETDVCVGDLFAVGSALVEISQPTERCGKPGRALDVPPLRKWFFECLYSGYYLRVIQTGWVRCGDELILRERRYPAWSVDRVNRAVQREMADQAAFEEMLALPLLSSDWKDRALILRERWLVARERSDG